MAFILNNYKEFFNQIKEPLHKKWGYEDDISNLVLEIFWLYGQLKRIQSISESLLDEIPKYEKKF